MSRKDRDFIEVCGLEVHGHIGASEGERAHPQRLEIDLRYSPEQNFLAMGDRLEDAVDYVSVIAYVRSEVESAPRLLIETLAKDLAVGLLSKFPLQRVDITVKKFILPGTKWVAAHAILEK